MGRLNLESLIDERWNLDPLLSKTRHVHHTVPYQTPRSSRVPRRLPLHVTASTSQHWNRRAKLRGKSFIATSSRFARLIYHPRHDTTASRAIHPIAQRAPYKLSPSESDASSPRCCLRKTRTRTKWAAISIGPRRLNRPTTMAQAPFRPL